jgi:hypothetical protein
MATESQNGRTLPQVKAGLAESRLGESDPGPTHYECVALPTELRRLAPRSQGSLAEGACRTGPGQNRTSPHAKQSKPNSKRDFQLLR